MGAWAGGGLEKSGANVWLNQIDIAPGKRWARAVQNALTDCPRVLVVLSPSSVESANVQDEVTFALEEKKTVIPIFYRDCKVMLQLRGLQYADFRSDYARGLNTLLKTLDVTREVAAGAAVSAATTTGGTPPAEVEDTPAQPEKSSAQVWLTEENSRRGRLAHAKRRLRRKRERGSGETGNG